MIQKILRFLNVGADERGRVGLLLIMSFFMGVFVATYSVASQSLFLQNFANDLPIALLLSGAFGLLATVVYNFLQNRIPFSVLAAGSLFIITLLTIFMEFGEPWLDDPKNIYWYGFISFIPFSFLLLLVFWGAFGRLFNLRQSKRLLGTVDQGAMIASFIAFFFIPQFLELTKDIADTEILYSVSLVSIICFLVLFVFLSFRYLTTVKGRSFAREKMLNQKVNFVAFISNKYLFYMSLFVIVSMIAVTFVEYSFLSTTNSYAETKDEDTLARFLAYFEMTVVIFSFLFDNFAQDRIIKEYGMRVSLLINPILIGFFTACALVLGSVFGYQTESSFFVVFFIVISVSKLFMRSLKDTIDETVFRLYLLPLEANIRIDVQTKINGTVTAFASLVAGGLIYLITEVESFGSLAITAFTLPFFVLWFIVTNRMHQSYKATLESTLVRGKEKSGRRAKEYAVSTLLEKEVSSTVEDKVIYSLKLMEKLEPALFETSLIRLSNSESKTIRLFVQEKLKTVGVNDPSRTEIRTLAESAADATLDTELLSIAPEKLVKLSKSGKQGDRILAAKLLRQLISPKTIFILLELLRDIDPKVRLEALHTARKVKRPETWPVLIELLGSPTYSHVAAAALKEVGEKVLNTLESAFHRSGQSDIVMLRIVQVMGRIGSKLALQLLWRKADYPDKRIVKQILYSLRYINYRAEGREIRDVFNLLETEISKTIWNLAAIHELPDDEEFKFLRDALQEEVRDNYDQIFMLLSILYDQQNIQLVRENLESADPDNIAFALELIDLFLDAELKPKLIPLLDDSPTPQKLRELQHFFPRENYTPIQVINYILNRDYNYNNRWTKVCAIHASAYVQDFRVSRGLVAQMFNSDRLLQETAAWVVYNKDRNLYQRITERLPAKDKKFLDTSIENNQLLDGLNDGFFLFIEMVMFIKQSPLFRNIHGLLISDLGDKITPLDLERGETIRFNPDDTNPPLFIAAHGQVKLWSGDHLITQMRPGDVYGEIFHNGPVTRVSSIEAAERSVVFKINLMDFYFVMANHHELVQGLIRNITEEEHIEIKG
jgi:ATP:ADP antiporter, AAA family